MMSIASFSTGFVCKKAKNILYLGHIFEEIKRWEDVTYRKL